MNVRNPDLTVFLLMKGLFKIIVCALVTPDRVVLDDGSVFGREIKRTWGNDFRDSDGNKWKKCSKDEYKLDN